MILEREANSAPNDVPKQIALWEGLMSLKAPVAYERITSRWERLLALVNWGSDLVFVFRRTDLSPGLFEPLTAVG
jgi:hypothetical protein